MASSITEREVAAELKEKLNQHIQQGGTPLIKPQLNIIQAHVIQILHFGRLIHIKLLPSGN